MKHPEWTAALAEAVLFIAAVLAALWIVTSPADSVWLP